MVAELRRPIADDDVATYRRDGVMSPPFEEVTLEPGRPMDSDLFAVVPPAG